MLAWRSVACRENERRPIATLSPFFQRSHQPVWYWNLTLFPIFRSESVFRLGGDAHDTLLEIYIVPLGMRHFLLSESCHEVELKKDLFLLITNREEFFQLVIFVALWFTLHEFRPVRQFACLHLPLFFLSEPTRETKLLATAWNASLSCELISLILQQGWGLGEGMALEFLPQQPCGRFLVVFLAKNLTVALLAASTLSVFCSNSTGEQ